jgi:hypothetical protein
MSGRSLTILAHGMLGYGFPVASLTEAVRRGFQLIAVDAGSTDPGPYYLGSGRPFISRTMVHRDLELLLEAAVQTGAKMIVGSAGGAGTRSQLAFVAEIVREILTRRGWSLKLATIDSQLEPDVVRKALEDGRIETFETEVALTHADVDDAINIVAQIGVEPFIAALDAGADVVVAGRAWDVANVAALPIALGYPAGLALHLGKILECGGQAAVPVEGSDLLMGRLFDGHFEVESPNPAKACTVASVAAHTLYEKSNPVWLPGPGGIVDLKASVFEAIDDKRVRVTGSRFRTAERLTVKLEGARLAGYRHVVMAGIRDPLMIGQIDEICDAVLQRIARNLAGQLEPTDYSVLFRRYGIDAVMGKLEPDKTLPHEVGLLIDVVGRTPQIAEAVCAMARSLMLHWGYPGRKATSGNLAMPFSPADFPTGEVYEFNIYHLMAIDDPVALFPFSMETA